SSRSQHRQAFDGAPGKVSFEPGWLRALALARLTLRPVAVNYPPSARCPLRRSECKDSAANISVEITHVGTRPTAATRSRSCHRVGSAHLSCLTRVEMDDLVTVEYDRNVTRTNG